MTTIWRQCQRQVSSVVEAELAINRTIVVDEDLARDDSTTFDQHAKLHLRVHVKPRPSRIPTQTFDVSIFY